MRSLLAEAALRILRGLAAAAVAAVGLLMLAGAVDHGLHEPDGREGLPPRPGEGEGSGGLAVELGHFEGTTNWLTALGAFLWAAATPACTRSPALRRLSVAASAIGAGLVAYVAFYAFDQREHWEGGGSNFRPWITIALAACAAAAAGIGAALRSRAHAPDEARPETT